MPYVRRRKSSDGNSLNASQGLNVDRSVWYADIPIYLLVFFIPLAIGTVHLWSVSVMWTLAVLAFLALVLRRRRRKADLKLFPMGTALLAVSVLTFLQLIPLPPFLVRLVSPGAADLFDHLLSGIGLWGEGNWRPLSLAPPETAFELVKWISYVLVFIVVINTVADRYRARRLLKAVAWSGFVVALIGFFSKLFMAEAIYGIYTLPGEALFFSSFVNPNHLAGFLGLCGPVAVGIALSSRYRQEKALYGFISVIIGAALIISLSRGGIVAFCIGCGFLCVFAMTRRLRKLKNVVMAQVLAAGAMLVAGYLFYDTILNELRTLGDITAMQEYSKMRAWEGTLPMMLDHPVVGIGRGAFASVYPRYQTVEHQLTFTHPENQVLQNMVEWGPLWGLLFVGVFVWCFVMALKRARQSYALGGCLAAVFVVAAHNLVDFNLEIGGVALPFVVVLGVLVASPFSGAGSPTALESRFKLPHVAYPALLVSAILIGVLCIPYAAMHSLEADTEALSSQHHPQPAEPCSKTPLGMVACNSMRYHPADFMPALVVGKAYLDAKPPNLQRAIFWLSRAQYLNPTMSLTHRLSGRALFLGGYHEQALLEYRASARWDPKTLSSIIDEVMRLTDDVEMAIRAAPEDAEAYMELAYFFRRIEKNQAAKKAARLALEIDATLISAMDLLGELAWTQGRYEEALGFARQVIELDPLHDNAYYLVGRVYYSQKKQDLAEKVWIEGLTHVPDSTQLAYRIVELYLAQSRVTEAEKIADRLRSFAPSDDYSQAQLSLLAGNIQKAMGKLYEARKHYRMASTLAPANQYYLYLVGNMEEKMGDWKEAERIYEQLLVGGFRKDEMQERIEVVKRAQQEEKKRAMWETWVDQDQGDKTIDER